MLIGERQIWYLCRKIQWGSDQERPWAHLNRADRRFMLMNDFGHISQQILVVRTNLDCVHIFLLLLSQFYNAQCTFEINCNILILVGLCPQMHKSSSWKFTTLQSFEFSAVFWPSIKFDAAFLSSIKLDAAFADQITVLTDKDAPSPLNLKKHERVVKKCDVSLN